MSASPHTVGPDAVPSAVDDDRTRRRLGVAFWACIAWIVLVAALALLAPWLPIDDPETLNTDTIRPGAATPASPPSLTHPFGTDALTRDVLARTIWGARVSLVVGFVAVAFGLVVGGGAGLLAGHFRGWSDRVISFVFVALLSFPALVLAILITSLVDRSLTTVSVTLGILAIAPVGRVARATTLSFAEREFVVAARTLGAGHRRILVRELLPNVAVPMAALALLGIAIAIVAEGGLAFLGLSVEEGISWGTLIRDGSGPDTLRNSWWMAMMPITVLFATVLALNFAGDRLRSHFDVKDAALG